MILAEKIAKWKPLGFLGRSVENPETPISDPAQWLLDAIGMPSVSGVSVTENTAVNLTSVWRAVNLNSNIIAALPLGVFEKTTSGRNKLPNHDVAQLLKNPNDFMTSYDWRRTQTTNEGLSGNGIARISFNPNTARPTSIMPLEWWKVSTAVDNGRLFYVITLEDGSTDIVDQTNIIHFKGFSFNGIWGKSPVRVMNEALGGALAAQEFGSRFFGNGANMGGFLSTEGKLSDKALERLRTSMLTWQKLRNANKPQILEEGLKYEKMGIPPEDAQFLGTRKFQVTEVARMFDVPPPLMYDLERATFANVEKMILAFVKFDLAPKAAAKEQELTRKLIREDEQGKIFISFNLEGLLRGDEKARGEFYQKLFGVGAIDSNEVRSLENMNAYDGGNKKWVPMNFQQNDGESNAEIQQFLKNLEIKLNKIPLNGQEH